MSSPKVETGNSGIFNYVPEAIAGYLKKPEWLVFVQSYLSQSRAVGTPFSCSSYVANRMVSHIPTATDSGKKYLEIGPGTGVVTQLFVEKLGPNDTLDVVEIEEGFFELIKKKFESDPRVRVHHADIAEWAKTAGQFDAIATGVPLNALPNETIIRGVLGAYEKLAKTGAVISAVEYVGTSTFSQMIKFGAAESEYDKVVTLKCRFFSHHAQKPAEIEWKNFPVPARVHFLTMGESFFETQ